MRTLNELITDLDALPGKLAGARQTLGGAAMTLKGVKDTVDDMEADVLAEVSIELDERGKPRYSNKESRDAAVRKILLAKPEYRTAASRLAAGELEKQNAEITLGQLEDTQKSLHAQLEAALAESRSETIRELTRSVLELARLEGQRLAQKEESSHV